MSFGSAAGFGFGSSVNPTGLGTNGFEVSLNYITGVPDSNSLTCSSHLKLIIKALLKRDDTTREKGIAELLSYISSNQNEIDDDLIIISWCQLYSKLSIDNSKKVRMVSHQIQSKFVSILGKRYVKYLKDTIGIWLSGCFDSDRVTSRTCITSISEAFGNSEDKVANLWRIFSHQILNYSSQVFLFESKDTISDERFVGKDESETKYLRVLLSSIQLFNQVLVKSSNSNFDLKDESKELIDQILNTEKYQDLFFSKDFQIKKSSYQSLKTVILSKDNKGLLNAKLFKDLAKAMVKGLKPSKNVNVLLYSGTVIPVLDSIITATNYDPSFWASIKKADEKLLEFLRMGSISSDASYYEILSNLLNILPSDFLPLNDVRKLKPFLNILETNVKNEKLPQFVAGAWKCYIEFTANVLPNLDDDQSDEILDQVLKSVVMFLDNMRVLSPALILSLADVLKLSNSNKDVLLDINIDVLNALPSRDIELPDFEIKIRNQTNFVQNFINLLVATKSDILTDLLSNSIEALNDQQDEYQPPKLSFNIIDNFIKKNLTDYEDQISKFIYDLGNFINSDFIEEPLSLLIDYSNSQFKSDSYSLINAIFLKLSEPNDINLLLSKVTQIKAFEMSKCEDLNKYIHDKSGMSRSASELATNDKNDDRLMFKFLTPEILNNLFNALSENEEYDQFIANCVANYQNSPFLSFSKENQKFTSHLWAHLDSNAASHLLDKLECNLDDAEFRTVYFNGLEEVIGNTKLEKFVLNRVEKLSLDILKNLLPSDLLGSIESSIGTKLDTKLSISNSLGSIIYMFKNASESDNTTYDKQLLGSLFSKASFYLQLIEKHPALLSENNGNLLAQLGLIGEIAIDHIFLAKVGTVLEDKLISLQSDTSGKIVSTSKNVEFDKLVGSFIEGTGSGPFGYLLDLLQSSENVVIKYYAARIIKTILTDGFESLPASKFETLNFTKLARSTTKLAVMMLSCNKFLTCSNLDRIRNQVAANIVGLRSSEDITSVGLDSLIILNSFMDLDLDFNIPDGFQLIPAQRFMMILNNLTNWLDSDIAYDKEFIPNRVVLIQFVETYIKSVYYVCDSGYPSDFIGKVFDLGLRLCSESLNMISSDSGDLSLQHASLKLFILLDQYSNDVEEWRESVGDVYDDLVQIFFKQTELKDESQPVKLIDELVLRIFSKLIPIEKLQPSYNKLFDLVNSQNVEMQRVSTSLLHSLIPAVQDELVLETTLNRNSEDLEDAKLPEVLVKNITEHPIHDYIEFEDPYEVNKYLWSWYLIFDHFKNITQKIRQDYINQLGEDLVFSFLNFVFKQLDLSKLKIEDQEKDYIKNYSIINDKTTVSSEELQEAKKLLVNLLYFCCKYLGGSLTQTWFQSIRDKQLKTAVEKFIVKSISPSLIEETLASLGDKNSLEDNEFKIRLNKTNNEIKCFYEIDEQKIEISIALPANYPLSQIAINGLTRLGVDEKKWKSWILSCQYVINIQKGTILEAIQHFKNNVKLNFENYEDCAICYSILHVIDHSTPNKVCSTCKHNFHSACLYRWFKSSGSSTCPLCRTKFQFKKHS